ncbi:hypothetical protein D1872_205270 [compost metagenome]
MPVEQNLPGYFKTFSDELDVIKDRVRNIIGSTHWGADGSHKEAILQAVLANFIPKKYSIGSGFVISDDGHECSKQIDIIVYDNSSPTFFQYCDFVIIPIHYVKAVIEVKTNIGKGDQLNKALANLFSAQKLINKSADELYTGIFSYEYGEIRAENAKAISRNIFQKISEFYTLKFKDLGYNQKNFLERCILTSICINNQFYGLYWNEHEVENCKFGIYHTEKQSFNFFVSNLLNTLDKDIVNNSKQLW